MMVKVWAQSDKDALSWNQAQALRVEDKMEKGIQVRKYVPRLESRCCNRWWAQSADE